MLTQPHDARAPHETAAQAINDRRRRQRIASATEGWLISDSGEISEPWEVRIKDISRIGVGFESTEKMKRGDTCRIRVGRGPIRLARRIRIVSCRAGAQGHYLIGSEFAGETQQDA